MEVVIWRVERSSSGAFGRALLCDLDLDCDARPDVLATTPGDSSNVRIRANDHAGRFLYIVNRPPEMLEIGANNLVTIARLGDSTTTALMTT